MRVLIIHNEYVIKGGEESAVKNEIDALTALGHEVVAYVVNSSEIDSLWRKAKAFLSAIYNVRQKKIIETEIRRFKPDIVHVHNFTPIISPSVFYACRACNVPNVLTLHNYRIVCPSTVLYVNGEPFRESLRGNYWAALRKRVYRDSYLGTLSILLSIVIHRKMGTWKLIDEIIVLSEFQNDIISSVIKRPVKTVPNFLPINVKQKKALDPDHYFLYVGRLSEEKGIADLMRIWPSDSTLLVVGSGPLWNSLQKLNNDSGWIKLLGAKSQKDVFKLMSKAQGLIVPSKVHETFGLVCIESFAMGTPVIFNDIAPLHEVVTTGRTGAQFRLGDTHSLEKALKTVKKHRSTLSENCLNAFQDRYSLDAGGMRLLHLFNEILRHHR